MLITNCITMPVSKAATYPPWELLFATYWRVADSKSRQQPLLDYFITCGTLEESVTDLTNDVMSRIISDDVISNPFSIGKKSVHQERKFTTMCYC